MKAGICSITFRKLEPSAIVDLAARAGLRGIEWGGDIHVPHGDLAAARRVKALTRDAGLQVSSYGSYYLAGGAESQGLRFEDVLQTACELGAPLIRIWAGQKGSVEATADYREVVAADLRRVAVLAATAGVGVGLEWHGGTLTDRPDSTLKLLEEIGHPNVRLYWQPNVGDDVPACLQGLEQALPYLANVHLFHWRAGVGGLERRPLAEDAAVLQKYLNVVRKNKKDRWILMEFVRDDSPTQFLEDAAVLKSWMEQAADSAS